MKLENKIIIKLVLSILIIISLIFPFDSVGISSIKLFVNEMIVIDVKYIFSGILFLVVFVLKLSQLKKEIELNTIIDKCLVVATLIALTAKGLITPIISIVIILSELLIGHYLEVSYKLKISKVKDIMLFISIILTLFNNLPFELINLRISNLLFIITAVLATIDAFYHYEKKVIK